MSVIAGRIASLGLALPQLPRGSKLAPATASGRLVFVSGFSSNTEGRLGDNLSIAEGATAAQEAILACLAEVQWLISNLDDISRVLKLLGFVCCTPEFDAHPAVLNGATELLLSLFGPRRGYHARSAIGSTSLDSGAAVEIEAIFEMRRASVARGHVRSALRRSAGSSQTSAWRSDAGERQY